jgi:acyl-CoA synthetase (AMP-forming)/AMP-acid ligase II
VTDISNIASYLPLVAAEQPDALAVAVPVGRKTKGRPRYRRLSYRELDDRSDRIAQGLARIGIGRGVRTALLVPPSLDFAALAFAVLKAGAVPVLVDPGIGLRNMGGCLATAEPEAFIGVPAAHLARLVLGWGRPSVRHLVTVGRRAPWGGVTLVDVEARGAGDGPDVAPTSAEDVAAVVFTSGSTGPPKGVVYTHGNFLAQVEAVRDLLGVTSADIDLPTFPLFALFDPALGMATVIPRMDPTRPARVDPHNIIDPINEFGVTTMFGSPALLDTVGRFGERHGVRLPSLRRVVSAGAPVAPQTIERFLTMLPAGARILTPYGATEALPVAVISSDVILEETRARTDSGAGVCVGRPVDSIELAILPICDEPIPAWEANQALPPGEIGEIVVKGAQVTTSYYRAPRHDELSKIADNDGTVRHRMGDLGYLDDEGRLWFVGRKSHRVETAAGSMFTVPCEAVFNTHPSVFRSALVGVEENGETIPVLCVELERGVRNRDRRRITAELLEIAAGHQHTRSIRRFLYHPGFPVDVRHNAKIDRRKLAVWASRRMKRRASRGVTT